MLECGAHAIHDFDRYIGLPNNMSGPGIYISMRKGLHYKKLINRIFPQMIHL